MKKMTKGALLSALVCPGAGHLALDSDRRGWIYLILTLLCFALLLATIVPVAISISTDLTNGTLPLGNLLAIRAEFYERLAELGGKKMFYSTATLVLVWIIALVDVIQVGRALDRKAKQ